MGVSKIDLVKRILLFHFFTLLFYANHLNTNGQTRLNKMFWGDTLLEPVYGLSTFPPYDIDSSLIVAYHLPENLTWEINKNVDFFMLALYKNATDTIPDELALYSQGKIYGFFIDWNEQGNLVRIKEKPTGVNMNFSNFQIKEVINETIIGSPYFRIILNSPFGFTINVKINGELHSYFFSNDGVTISEEVKTNGKIQYHKLYFFSK